MRYKISQFARKRNVTIRTVWNWMYKGLVQHETDETGHHWIVESEEEANRQLNVAVYARVSSSENKNNLDTQAERLISYCNAKAYKVCKVVKETGSGLNDERQKLEKLLTDGSIDIIVVEHKDRLARFGINYIQKLLAMQGRTVEIVNNVEGEKEDLMQDFVSIITSFCARLYGNRRNKRRTERIIEELSKEE